MHSFSSNGVALLVCVTHSDSRVQTCLQRVLRGWVQAVASKRRSADFTTPLYCGR